LRSPPAACCGVGTIVKANNVIVDTALHDTLGIGPFPRGCCEKAAPRSPAQKSALAGNLSLTDELTGLRNRRGFFLFAEQARSLAVRAGKQSDILFAELDGLKDVNDRHGREAGDALLRNFAGVLAETFRESDVMARVGGDEFCVFGAELNLNPEVLLARLD